MNACKSMKIAIVKRDWTQSRLSDVTGLSQAAISRLANNQNWNCASLQRMADAFDMKVSEFVALGED